MTIHEIRESIELNEITLNADGFGIVQKVINLKDNRSHKMLQCDAFIDNPSPLFSGDGYIIELLVSSQPIIYTDMEIQNFSNRSPAAANEHILFKEYFSNLARIDNRVFPNRFISARPTFTWYMPKLYITALIHGERDMIMNNLALSVYCAVESKKASLVTYGMGVIREDNIAQVAAIMSNGRFIEPFRNVGQSFPMWKYGGVRPELMISGANLASWFNRTDSQEAGQTNTTSRLRLMAKAARQMQPNLDAFGSTLPLDGAIPSWVRMELFKGVESGPIRDQWPPTKYADNGNTLTF